MIPNVVSHKSKASYVCIRVWRLLLLASGVTWKSSWNVHGKWDVYSEVMYANVLVFRMSYAASRSLGSQWSWTRLYGVTKSWKPMKLDAPIRGHGVLEANEAGRAFTVSESWKPMKLDAPSRHSQSRRRREWCYLLLSDADCPNRCKFTICELISHLDVSNM